MMTRGISHIAIGPGIVVPPTLAKTRDGTFNNVFLHDPDGILVQRDELIDAADA